MLKPRVLVICYFQPGTPDQLSPIGEAQRWVERGGIDQHVDIPGLSLGMFHSADGTRALVVTGLGKANSGTGLMLLAASGKVDLTGTYLLVAAIGGCTAERCSPGSVAIARHVVDGDLSSMLPRDQLPPEFPFIRFPLGCFEPWCDKGLPTGTECFALNTLLAEWALSRANDVELVDDDATRKYREPYCQEVARRPPFLLLGTTMGSDTIFFGDQFSDWAKSWVDHWTKGEGRFTIVALDDSGLTAAAHRLGEAGLVDFSRLIVARGACNFIQPAASQTTWDGFKASTTVPFPAQSSALENVFRVGSAVATALCDGNPSR